MATTTAGVQLERSISAGGDGTDTPERAVRRVLSPSDAGPQGLKQVTSLVLASNVPLCFVWGRERVHLWNSEFPVGGAGPLDSTGRACKGGDRPAQPAGGANLERCFETGEASRLIDTPLFLERNGRLEEVFFSLFFSPVRDESGRVVGVLHPVVETTQLVLAKRRGRLLRQIVERCAGVESVERALSLAAEAMAEHPFDVPFAALYRVAPGGGDRGGTADLAACTGSVVGHPACPPSVNYGREAVTAWPFEKAMKEPGPLLVQGIEDRFPDWTCGPYSQPPRQALVHRIDVAGQPVALLIAGISSMRPFDEEYQGFQKELASTVTGIVSNACVAQERSRRAEADAEKQRAEAMTRQARQEVEAFAHTLSHDVRAPIRHLDGFVQMLEELEAATLSAEGKRLLRRFRASADRMGSLIDDLVRLSQVGRGGTTRINVDTQAMVRAVWNEAVEKAAVPAVLDLKPLPAADADPALLRMLWQNLIGNAVKFSAMREQPRVTIDAWSEGERTWYRISDNGIGFDDQYAYKLFNIFQRLHRPDQFPGTGVGLALVKKIVGLHGGLIRGRGTPDRGAVFEFTLAG